MINDNDKLLFLIVVDQLYICYILTKITASALTVFLLIFN